jgi:hypothetical protein
VEFYRGSQNRSFLVKSAFNIAKNYLANPGPRVVGFALLI